MIHELREPGKTAALFAGWEETIIYSCLQGVMGKIYATDPDRPQSACAMLGDFGFYAGRPDPELPFIRDRYFIAVPKTEDWHPLMEKALPGARKITRYATRKDTVYNPDQLKAYCKKLPAEYTLAEIDDRLYDACLDDRMASAFVSCYENKAAFLKKGMGYVILKDNEIVSGASSYSTYNGGIEIEVDTKDAESRKGLAAAACSALILKCLERGLYPSWDAHHIGSLRLAEKLGYVFSHPYPAYEAGING